MAGTRGWVLLIGEVGDAVRPCDGGVEREDRGSGRATKNHLDKQEGMNIRANETFSYNVHTLCPAVNFLYHKYSASLTIDLPCTDKLQDQI